MRKKIGKFFLGTDEKIEERAEKLAKVTQKDFDDMKEAKVGFYDMPSTFEEE